MESPERVGPTRPLPTDNVEPGSEPRHRSDSTEQLSSAPLLSSLLWVLRLGPAFILLVLLVLMSILSPYFLQGQNIQALGVQSSIVAVVAIGELLVIICRGVDISVGAVVALSGVVGVSVAGMSWGSGATVVVVMLATGVAVGTLNAAFIIKAVYRSL